MDIEKITEKEVQNILEEDKKRMQQILKDGGKITNTIIYEKDKITTIRKIEPVKEKPTSSIIIQKVDEFVINSPTDTLGEIIKKGFISNK